MKQLLIYISMFLILAGSVSCNKWLELKPNDGLVREDFWKTKEQVSAAVTGIYASMLDNTTGKTWAMPEYLFIWGEARADMVSPGFATRAEEIDIVNMNILPTNSYANWRTFYETINYCNTVIKLAPNVMNEDNTFTQDMLNRAVGEALTIRGLMYFYLVRTFDQVPLKLEPTVSDNDLSSMVKSSSDSILNQIVSDLKAAENLLPESYGNTSVDRGRATKYTAATILADTYLWMEKYAECAAQCDKVIASGRYGLVNQETSLFNALFWIGNSVESIFELQYDAQKLNPFFMMFAANSRRWSAASHLMEEVYGVDMVNAIPVKDKRGDGMALRAEDATIWKYMGANDAGTATRTADQSFAHWIFYRYADILLMKAEAINQLDQPIEASRLVKTIRERATALDFGDAMDSTSKSGMEEYILQERSREFAFEGKRWYDLVRNAKRNNFAGLRYLINSASKSIAPDMQQSAYAKLRDRNSLFMPIALYELQTNKLLVQNPFYK
ncbi:RagB/SusD family nutrient uptake outer membrane protein [Chitinophaga sp. sic0106]|uniref:RagB/SusD family nutrient uptake outer membrane protein n=1 Tax=Chitinophaga sp. sic0106 TaxID=2854785 RepID=UPI001C44116C|nr:RagB/SusD family nutrient uptake outer membrane protein [Chitinophaga sp. sic0106]MBV7529194.1 RagB/SusD family nutrient uptake outer membrane protein [Chitinophaga sp. sic0106]